MSDNFGLAGGDRNRYRSGRGRPVDAGLNQHIDDDDAAAFALGALDAAERDVIERHCRLCPACASLIARDLTTAGVLAYAARPVAPSLAAKTALFTRIAHTQRAAAEIKLPTVAPSTLPPALTIPASRAVVANATSVDHERPAAYAAARSSGRMGRLVQYLSAPLMLGLLAIGVWGFNLQSQVGSLNAAVAARDATVAEMQAVVGGFASGPVREYQLDAKNPASAVQGSLLVGSDPRVVVLSLKLFDPTANRDYEMWMVDQNGKIVPKRAAEIQVGDDGSSATIVTLDQPIDNYQRVYVKAKPITAGAVDDVNALQSDIGDPLGIGSTSGDANGAQENVLP